MISQIDRLLITVDDDFYRLNDFNYPCSLYLTPEVIISLQQVFNGEDVTTLLVPRQIKQDEKNNVELEFYRLAENWKYETASLSSITKKTIHKDYLKIIEMGQDVLPFILRSLLEDTDHWFVTLKKISKEDPIPAGATFPDAVNGWLKWGQEKGLI